MEPVSVEGRTLRDAIDQACSELGLDERSLQYRLDVDHFRDEFGKVRGVDTVKILAWASENPTSALQKTAEPQKAEARPAPRASADAAEDTRGSERESVSVDDADEDDDRERPAADSDAVVEIILSFVSDTLDKMGIGTKIESEFDDDRLRISLVDFQGEWLSGRSLRNVLSSLEYLSSRLTTVERGASPRVAISVGEDDESAKEAALVAVAGKVAELVARTGRALTLKPMNSWERRVVHLAISKIDGVGSQSIGESRRKRVEVFPEDDD